jgi:hypothetical protein
MFTFNFLTDNYDDHFELQKQLEDYYKDFSINNDENKNIVKCRMISLFSLKISLPLSQYCYDKLKDIPKNFYNSKEWIIDGLENILLFKHLCNENFITILLE